MNAEVERTLGAEVKRQEYRAMMRAWTQVPEAGQDDGGGLEWEGGHGTSRVQPFIIGTLAYGDAG